MVNKSNSTGRHVAAKGYFVSPVVRVAVRGNCRESCIMNEPFQLRLTQLRPHRYPRHHLVRSPFTLPVLLPSAGLVIGVLTARHPFCFPPTPCRFCSIYLSILQSLLKRP